MTAAQLPADVRVADGGERAEELARRSPPHVVIADTRLPDMTIADMMARLSIHAPLAPCIVFANQASVGQVVEMMRAGAFTVLEQPVARETLLAALNTACDEYRARRERPSKGQAGPTAIDAIIGRSRPLLTMLDMLKSVAPSDANCLIVGENGTGKERVADAIHESSPRAGAPFIKINCAAIPAELLESELFGHKKGSFTGAIADRQGLFERANGGSLFLDEIAEMPPYLQAKLLRVLQEREFLPVGGTCPVLMDVRLICATNADVAKAVQDGRLRKDLLFRINTITLRVPPLRERTDDLPLLCAHFLDTFAAQHDRPLRRISADALEAMRRYHWPGNVRELEHVVERAVILSTSGELDLAALPHEIRSPRTLAGKPPLTLMRLDEIERRALLAALERAKWNKQAAAAALGIRRPTLYSKMRKYAIKAPDRGAWVVGSDC
jgi:DNA-binding NtrC family response regulator